MTSHFERSPGPRALRLRPLLRVPLLLVPLLVYVGVTVIAPALNGATRRDGFWEHAAITVAISSLVTSIWIGVRRVKGQIKLASSPPGFVRSRIVK